MKYYSAVNRELNNDADDDEEAIIYTHDTLDAISNISINDKFLSYSCEIEPLLNQAYYNEGNSLTKYFHVIGTDEYKGFYINNFNGRWITANGQYFRSYRKNKKNSYIHESGNWLVFYSITKPNCKKTEIKGAWVLLKIDSRNFAEKEESELFADKFLWMYGFKESEFNGNVNNDSIEISSVKFSTNFGTGPTDTDLPYESNIELYEDLSKNELFIQTESTKSSRKIVDSSFTIIPVKDKFRFADKYAVNYIGARNNILAWSVIIKSVENKLPPRAVYSKVYPEKDMDVTVEVSYENTFEKILPKVRLLGSDVRTSTINKIEGTYYKTTKIINKYPVFRNAHDYYIYYDTYTDKDGSMNVWVVGDEIIPLTDPANSIVNTGKEIFVSDSGECVTDEFYFRLGYDLTPNIFSYDDRDLVVAEGFRNAKLLRDRDTIIEWGARRNIDACSVCDDNNSSSYTINIMPENASSLYIGPRIRVDDINGELNINIKCNRLDCTGDLFDFYGNYTKSIQFGDFANPVYFNNNTENVQFELTETGWELGYNVVIFNDTVSFVSSKNQRVKNFDLKYEYPKYGTYIADTGSVVNIEIEKDEYDDVVLLSSSDEVKFNNKIFTKSHSCIIKEVYGILMKNYLFIILKTK